MSTEKPIKDPVREELKLLLGDDIVDNSFEPREGIEISQFSITPSEEYLKGAHGIKVRHLPLNQEETEVLGLEFNRDKPVKVTLMILAPHQEKELVGRLLNSRQEAFSKLLTSWGYYAGISDNVLGKAGSYPERNTQIDFFQKTIEENPDKEILIIVGHGLTTEKFKVKGKLVGSWQDHSVEYIEEILDAEDLSQYSAVVDGACNESHIPEFNPSSTPYFASLGSVGGITSESRGIIIQNGQVEEFNT